MAAITFPSSPTVNDTFTASGKSWTWTGTVWHANATTHSATHATGGADELSPEAIGAASIEELSACALDISHYGGIVNSLMDGSGSVVYAMNASEANHSRSADSATYAERAGEADNPSAGGSLYIACQSASTALQDASAFATAEQGLRADTAVQQSDIGMLFLGPNGDGSGLTGITLAAHVSSIEDHNVSELSNDVGYVKTSELATASVAFASGADGVNYLTGHSISELFNDQGYITITDVGNANAWSANSAGTATYADSAGSAQTSSTLDGHSASDFILTSDIGSSVLAPTGDGSGLAGVRRPASFELSAYVPDPAIYSNWYPADMLHEFVSYGGAWVEVSRSRDYETSGGIVIGNGGTTLMAVPNSTDGSFVIPDGITAIAANAFFDCEHITEVSIPSSVTSIGDFAFKGCNSLSSLTIPDSVTMIGNSAFIGCSSLTSIVIPSSVTRIEASAFNSTGLTSITIPSSVTSIGDFAFAGSGNLTSIVFSSGLTSIGINVFYGCTGLVSVTLPATLSSLGNYSFSHCSSLESATFDGNDPAYVGAGVFESTHSGFTVKYHTGALGFSNPWHGFPCVAI
ncbi:MAG: leucine-rich repeat domain-containing protein [Verrucomicrobiae bacterium]